MTRPSPTPIRFAAAEIAFGLVDDADPPYLHVAFAGGGHYLQFQRQQPLADDEDWGLYVEVDDPARSGYECVGTCDLSADEMVVVMVEPLGPTDDEVTRVEVTFDAGAAVPPGLVDCLRAVFAGRERRLRTRL